MNKLESCGDKDKPDDAYRSRILAAAGRLFEVSGIDSVNMYQIAQEAGIGQGTLYRRYAHMGEICSDLLHSDTERFIAEMESCESGNGDASASPLYRLERMIERIIDYIDDHAELLSAINSMYAGKKSFLPNKRPIASRLHKLLSTPLEQALEQGEAVDGLDATQTANLLLAALAPEQFLYHRDTLGYGKERYFEGIRRLFIDGVRKSK